MSTASRSSISRQDQQRLQSLVLDGATASAVVYMVITRPAYFNPWNLTGMQWLVGGVLLRGAIAFYDHLVFYLIEAFAVNKRTLLLPTRTTGKPVRYVGLDRKSIAFLIINAVHEWIFVQRLLHYLWTCPDISLKLSDVGLLNTAGAMAVMFIVLDVCYAPCHHLMHQPWLYPLIHKHHHRQHFPTRGYLDAGNEHVIEHFVGVCCTWAAVLAATHGPSGAHAVTIFVFFNLHAALAMLNHSPYAVEFDILPMGLMKYKVEHHEMHHRKFVVNYAQYCLWYDFLCNTYAAYEGPTTTSPDKKK